MSAFDDSKDNKHTSDILVPTDLSGDPIKYDGNVATLAGILYEVGQYCKRNGLFQLLLQHHAADVGRGVIAVKDFSTIPFVLGQATERPRHMGDPCPPTTPARIANYNATSMGKFVPLTAAPSGYERQFILSPYSVDKEDAHLLRMWTKVLGDADGAMDFVENANGSGVALITAIKDAYRNSKPTDKAAVLAHFKAVESAGVTGEITLESLDAFLKARRRQLICLAPPVRPQPADEVEMINLIAFRDPGIREVYELKVTMTPPTKLDEAVRLIKDTLRSRRRTEEIDSMTNGGGPAALAARGMRPAAPTIPSPPASPPASELSAITALLTALVAKMPVADPDKPVLNDGTKGKKGKKGKAATDAAAAKAAKDADRDKFLSSLPRGKDGTVTRWVEGMSLCRCGGKHLFRDCDKQQSANSVDGIDSMTPAEIQSALEAFLSKSNGSTGTAGCAVNVPVGNPVKHCDVATEPAPCMGCVDDMWCAPGRTNRPSFTAPVPRAAPSRPNVAPRVPCPSADATPVELSPVAGALNGTPDVGSRYTGDVRAFGCEGTVRAGSVASGTCFVSGVHKKVTSVTSPLLLAPTYSTTSYTACRSTSKTAAAAAPARPCGLENESDCRGRSIERAHAASRTKQASRAASARPGGLLNYLESPRTAACQLPHGVDGQAEGKGIVGARLPAGTDSFTQTIVDSAPHGTRDRSREVNDSGLPRTLSFPPGLNVNVNMAIRDPSLSSSDVPRTVPVTYHGRWLPAGAESASFVHSPPDSRELIRDAKGLSTSTASSPCHPALVAPRTASSGSPSAPRGAVGQGGGSRAVAVARDLARLLFVAHPDSGCTGSMTDDRSRLINVRPCKEAFASATGSVAYARCIGDLPALTRASSGELVIVVFTNVRWVPDFKYTLLSVRQLWREQRIDATFRDVDALVLPPSCGSLRLRFDARRALPTVPFASVTNLLRLGRGQLGLPASPPVAGNAASTSVTKASVPETRRSDHALAGDHGGVSPEPLAMSGSQTPPSGEPAGSPSALPTPRAPANGEDEVPKIHTASGPVVADAGGVPRTSRGTSSRPLGFARVGATAHVARLPASQAAELMHRRSHLGVDRLRALAHTTSDAPKVLASAPAAPPCVSCQLANIKRSKHASTLSAPAPEPGVLHYDLKEFCVSAFGNYRYVIFVIDEHTRFVFFECLKSKSDAAAAIARAIAAFNANVYTPLDSDGRAMPRPVVRRVHGDREGGLMSHYFKEFRAFASVDHTTSPPHDHDLNPIAERLIGVLSDAAAAVRLHSHASPRLWPWIIAYVVDWHNATASGVGSSTADQSISPHQRFTLRPPQVMDLATFGCRAVVLRAPQHQHKTSLSGRGEIGAFLGRSRNSKGSYDILVDGKIVTRSSVVVDEEHLMWAPASERHVPLTALSHAAAPPLQRPLVPASTAPSGSDVAAPATYHRMTRILNLFSGSYARTNGLTAKLKQRNWAEVDDVDNDGEKGGGWSHDLLRDDFYATLLAKAAAGVYDAMMIAFPCSTFAITRFFDATNGEGGDRGPPIIRDFDHPDGLPESEIDPKHRLELKLSNQLLERTVKLAIAARQSPARTTIIVENPADRSRDASIASAPEFERHGALWRTTAFKRLQAVAGLSGKATFAYCRLGSDYQKYTTLSYTPEAASVLDVLNEPDFQCNHQRGTHARRAGGRGRDGEFVSAEAAAYPERLCNVLAEAFTVARTGGGVVPSMPVIVKETVKNAGGPQAISEPEDVPTSIPMAPAPATGSGEPASAPRRDSGSAPSPIAFPDLTSATSISPPKPPTRGDRGLDGGYWARSSSGATGIDGRPKRATAQRTGTASYDETKRRPRPATTAPSPSGPPAPRSALDTIVEEADGENHTPGGTSMDSDAYVPFGAHALAAMRAAAAECAYDASMKLDASQDELAPVTDWIDLTADWSAPLASAAERATKRRPGGARSVTIEVALADGDTPSTASSASLVAAIAHALRADSPDAPSTHAEAVKRGGVWLPAERGELNNHARNESWVTITRDELPPGRKVHKLIWVYKTKRDGTAKARLCVQGSTLEANVDFKQVFAAALRYSSARGLFAYAARNGCSVRSVDLVAAYLQGKFVDGEVVFCHLPVGYPEYDSKGRPKLAKVLKPIYGIQQAGRRLQRMLFKWLEDQGFVKLDDSDPCIYKLTTPDGEILTIGLYVDNLQIVHSAKLDKNGRGPNGCAYNAFMDKLAAEWDVTDEGPMEDLLGIEVDYNDDGSIKLHQRKYIEKVVNRFLPNGPIGKAQSNSLPYSSDFVSHVNESLSQHDVAYPELVTELQSRVGCLMYAATSTRPDIAYPVHQLCKCLHKPTPELIAETDHVISYLSRTSHLGLTYSREHQRLAGFSDASWETRASTSGWVVLWQSAAVSWGSRKQKSIALSTCEAEIIALSEAAKDVVYLRKLVNGLDAPEPSPTSLATDSKSARDVSYNPEHHDAMKHVQRRHFFVRDMVESFELEVPFVPTDQNPADFFTKPMKNAARFREFRRIVMNERD